MSDVREVSEYHAAHPTPRAVTYECEFCGDTLYSYRALVECESRCEAEDTAARKGYVEPSTKLPVHWTDD